MTDSDRKWLQHLNTSIWKKCHDTYCGQPCEWWMETRQITDAEMARIVELAPQTVVEPVNACMGFNFGVNLYDIGDDTEREIRQAVKAHGGRPPRPDLLLSLTGHHLDTRFGETWRRLSPLSHNARNKALLAEFGFDILRDRNYYDY